MHLPPSKHASKFGVIKLHFRKRTRTLTYEQKVVGKAGRTSTASASMRIFTRSMGWFYNTPGKASS